MKSAQFLEEADHLEPADDEADNDERAEGIDPVPLRGRRVLPLLDFWGRIERDRKKGLKIIAAFGPWLLIGALLRLFTIQQGVARAGLRFGLKATVVPMSAPEACIDADKPVDIELIEAIMASKTAL